MKVNNRPSSIFFITALTKTGINYSDFQRITKSTIGDIGVFSILNSITIVPIVFAHKACLKLFVKCEKAYFCRKEFK